MEFDSLFWAAFQSSLVLGLVHGVNPCGHSWLVLAPFVSGEKRGDRVAYLTFSFLFGTAAACLLLGLSLGAVSAAIPPGLEEAVHTGTAVVLVALSLVLLIRPQLLHHHQHDDHHGGHTHEHDHHHDLDHHHSPAAGLVTRKKKLTGVALLGIGFVNMIIPCPTVAIMYSYALDSGHVVKSTAVFAIYALGTAIAVAGVIYAIFRVTRLLKTLAQDWIEALVMRSAGLITILFAGYSLWHP